MQLLDLFASRFAAGVHVAGDLTLLTPESELATYTFNKHVIKHRFCKTCGILPFGESTDAKGNAGVAINLRCLENLDLDAVPIMKWDGRSA